MTYLLFHDTLYPAIRQRTVGKSYIGKTGGGHLELGRIRHNHIFHNTFAGSHDIHRIGGLVSGDTEEVPRRVNGQQVKESFCLDIIVFNECLYRIFVLLTTDMLVSRKIRHNVEAFLLTEDPFKDRIGKVQGICPIFQIGRAHV